MEVDDMPHWIAVTDDDELNLKAAERILSFNGYKVSAFPSGEELIEFLKTNVPDLILLDVHMTGIDGFETLKRIKATRASRNIPVIFLTADNDADTETKALASGAMDFVTKPFIASVLLMRVHNTIQLIRLQDDLKTEVRIKTRDAMKEHERSERLSLQIVETLAGTIDAKDKYTNGHSTRVAEYAREIARRFGYDERAQDDIYMIGLLHDVGKIGVPDSIINKPSKLTPEEYDIIKTHPVVGFDILKSITEMPNLAIGAKWHHERFDGTGYPDGIAGLDIPEEARLISVAEAYDAMSSRRSYHSIYPQEYIKSEFIRCRGTQFDPTFTDIMLQMIEEDTKYLMREVYDENGVRTESVAAANRDEEKFNYLQTLDAGGIDTAVGLKYCMNDIDFYTEMLKDFTAGMEDRVNALERCFDDSDIDRYRVTVHSLKSASRTVGAVELSKAAETMEEAAKNYDADYISYNHDDLIIKMNTTVGAILMATAMYDR